MSLHDAIIKFLGKEDNYTPDQILKSLSAEKTNQNLEDLSNLPQRNIDNVERLIDGSAFDKKEKKDVEAKTHTSEIPEIDPNVLKEIEKLDSTPPDINELKSRILTQSYETPPESLIEAETLTKPSEESELKEGLPAMEKEISMERTTPPAEEIVPEKIEEGGELPSLEDFFGTETPEEEALPEFPEPEAETTVPAIEEEIPIPSAEEKKEEAIEFPEMKIPSSEEIPTPSTPQPPIEEKIPEPQEIPEKRVVPETPIGSTAKIEIDTDKAQKIRDKINKIVSPTLRKKIRKIILESTAPKKDIDEIITLLLLGEDEAKIKAIADRILPDSAVMEKAAVPPVTRKPRRRVIYTEETKRIKEFQKELKYTARFYILTLLFIVTFVLSIWQFVWIPLRAKAHFERGLSYFKVKDYPSAEQEFYQGRKVEDWRLFGPDLTWYNIYASNYIANKELDRAKEKYIQALDYNPYDEETIYNFADYYKKNVYPPKYEEAIKLYKRLLTKYPNKFDYLDKIGYTYIEWGDRVSDPVDKNTFYNEANRIYEEFSDKNKKNTDSLFRLLDIALRVSNKQRIDILFDTIDHINKRAVNINTLTELGKYYNNERELDRAKKVFDKMMPQRPQYDEAYYEYSRYLTMNFDFLRAIQAASNAVLLNSKNGKALNLLGELYIINNSIPNNINQAIASLENAKNISPYYYKPYANLGHIYFYNSLNFADPEKALQKAFDYYKTSLFYIDKNTKDFLLFYNLGWLYYKYGDYSDAFEMFSKIYVDDPSNPILSFNMGSVYYKLNKLLLAKIEFDKAIEYYQAIANKISYINPELERHKEIYTQLAKAYNNRGVIFSSLARRNKSQEYEQLALLDFYRAKDNASKINKIYAFAEYNIKYILNKNIRGKEAAFDDELLKRTTLQKITEEFRQKLINNL